MASTRLQIKTRVSLAVFLLLALLAIIQAEGRMAERRAKTETLRLGGLTVTAEIADTDAARIRGLSGRTALPAGRGMLFVFDQNGMYGIWMKKMNFPLDVLWFDQNFRIVGMRQDMLPSTFPEVFYPNEPALYALEVPSGAVRQSGVTVGDTLQRE